MQTETINERELLAGIDELAEFYRYEVVNKYLHLGWVLISTHVTGNGDPRERQERTCYCLGWPRSEGEVQRPKSEYDHIGRLPDDTEAR